MRLRAMRFVEYLRESLWLLPALAVILALVLQRGLIWLDRAVVDDVDGWVYFGGGAEGARTFLSTIAASVLTMTTLVFSITMLVLQLASSQLSPRVMRTFLRDRPNQIVLALFVGTFAFNLFALREVREDFVPGLTIGAGFMAILASIAAFVYFINHVAQSIRVSSVIDRVATETLATIDQLYPEGLGEPADARDELPDLLGTEPDRVFTWERRSAIVTAVDGDALLALGDRTSCTLALVPRIGDFVPRGSVVARAWGEVDELPDALPRNMLTTGRQRTMTQDAAFGFRQLVDIAERALSTGVNDPTTAVQALDQLHDLLAVIMFREIPSPYRYSEDGDLRLVLPRPGWDDYVALALDEIRDVGAGSQPVRDRLHVLLDDLLARAPESRREALVHQQERLRRQERLASPA